MRLTIIPLPVYLVAVAALAMLFYHLPGRAQTIDQPAIAVATQKLEGTRWARTVLLVVPNRGTHIGLILNRPLDVTMHQLYPNFAPAKDVKGPVYLGGPQHGDTVFALVRGASPGPTSIEMLPGVWLAIQADEIDRALVERLDARYFVGAIIWRPGLLAEEVRQGQLVLHPADAAKCFRDDPAGLWNELTPAGPRT
jgi:putative AlgH/UPF0301 family transcriptional regulator